MEKLSDLKREIEEKEKRIAESSLNEKRHSEMLGWLDRLAKGLMDLKGSILKVKVENQPEYPDQIKVSNLGDIKIPDQVQVKNLSDIRIPEYPDQISLKEPKWLSFKGILDAIKDLKKAIKEKKEIDFDKYTKKQNSLAVRLVTRDGADFYNAGGGSAGAGGVQSFLYKTNTHTGNSEIRVFQENHICLQNTTTTPLGANATFTGEWQDCLNYQEVNVSIVASHNSASNGLIIEWSADAVNVGDDDKFSYYAASGGTNYTPNPAFRYVRIKYINGAIQQTSMNLMTILRRSNTGGSFHRIDSTLKDDADARLQLAVPKLKTASNTYVSQQATTAGNAKMSIEEFDAAVSTDTNKLNTAVYLTDENGVISQMLGDTLYPGAPIMIDIDHHEVHCGDSYSATRAVDLGNGASDTIIINVPNNATKRYHLVADVNTELEAELNIYEGATTGADGTAITNYNRDRNSANTSTLAITHTPTNPSGGTLIYTSHWGSGRTFGGETRGQQEIILKNNTKYRFVITNSTANNNYISWRFSHYIHPDA